MNTLIKSSRVPSFRSLMEDFWNTENLFDRPFLRKELLPAVNIRETNENFEIEVAAPGYDKNDFKIDMQDNVLNISAEVKEERTEEEENYTRREFGYSSFNRSFTLPENVKEDSVHARYENGLLLLTLQKTEKSQPERKTIYIE